MRKIRKLERNVVIKEHVNKINKSGTLLLKVFCNEGLFTESCP